MFWKRFDGNGATDYYLSSDTFSQLLPNDAIDPKWFEKIDFQGNKKRARSFLDTILTGSIGETKLRQLAGESFKARRLCRGQPWKLDEQEFREAFLDCLLQNCFRIYSFRFGAEGKEWFKSMPPDPPPLPERKFPPAMDPSTPGWIEFELIWDDSEEPVGMVELDIETVYGQIKTKKSNQGGVLRLEDIERGACKIITKVPKNITVDQCAVPAPLLPTIEKKAAKYSKTDQAENYLSENHSEEPAKEEKEKRETPKAIVVLENRKVKTGETLKTIAIQADMEWQELAYFNWGTRDPKEIEECLINQVGCSKKKNNEYVFDDSDSPGIIYIPKPWQERGYPTGLTNVIRLAKLKALHLELITEEGVQLPEIEYLLKFSDGSEQAGAVGKNGSALILYPSMLDYDIDYPNPLDLRAKEFAGTIRREFEEHKTEKLFKLLAREEELIKATIAVYDKYFNTYTKKGFMEDVYQEVTDPSALFVLEGVMELLGIETKRSALANGVKAEE